MKRIPLLALGVAIVLIANGVALTHAARNRAGTPTAEITLTNLELAYAGRSLSDDDSGVTLSLQWTVPNDDGSPYGRGFPQWLTREKLKALGFDCSVDPAARDALRFYQRQRTRNAFVALEYNGVAWQTWLNNAKRAAEQRSHPEYSPGDYVQHQSRLVVVDANADASKLRAQYPNRSMVVIVPAIIAITLDPYPHVAIKADPKNKVRIKGRIDQLASSIHVPRPFSNLFSTLGQPKDQGGSARSYVVHLRYGSSFEPWVTGVKFPK